MSYFKFDNKKVFYKQIGKGEPLILLHGNTASSKMFNSIVNEYSKDFQLILLDFPGHGKSERLDQFDLDFWFYNAKVCAALIDELNYDKVTLVGSSGGALVAINVGLICPNKINYIIADSFGGDCPLNSYIDSLQEERNNGKKKIFTRLFWFHNHGWDWEKIVDLDTQVNIEFAKTGKSFFRKSIADLTVPALFTGSFKDEYFDSLKEIYEKLKEQNPLISIYMFQDGGHPAILSNKKDFLKLIKYKLKKIKKIVNY
ncbi:MAG: alpha/beta fold hydrolase [Bacteroidales bacterium]|nr:alpha/beta fold hydrolase [Bacteroidales bacterium]